MSARTFTVAVALAIVAGAAAAQSQSITAQAMVGPAFLNKIGAAVVPLLDAALPKLVVPAINSKNVQVAPIHFTTFRIGSTSAAFAAPSQATLSLSKLSIAVPATKFTVQAKLDDAAVITSQRALGGGIKCSGTLSLNVSDAAFVVTQTLGKNATDGKLAVSGVSTVAKWGAVNVDVALSGLCKDIIDGIVPHLNSKIAAAIESKAAALVTKAVTGAFAKILPIVPGTLAAAPVASAAGVWVALDLYGNASVAEPAFIASVFPARDLEVSVDTASVDNALQIATVAGLFNHAIDLNVATANTSIFEKLLPAKFALCPNCALQVTTKAGGAPTLTFPAASTGAVSFQINELVVGVNGLNVSEPLPTAVPLLGLAVNATLQASNCTTSGAAGATVKFALAIPSFTFAAVNNSLPALDVSLLNAALRSLLHDVILPKFNAGFKGITLPSSNFLNVTQVELAASGGAVFAGFDVAIAL
jgi:hypothetical protein